MAVPETVYTVCRIAEQFYKLGGRSEIELFERSGYLENPETITDEALRAEFEQHPALVSFWVRLSEDSRASVGPFLLRPSGADNGRWQVAHYPGGSSEQFDDAAAACADFVVHKMTQLHRSWNLIQHPTPKMAFTLWAAKNPKWIPTWLFWRLFVQRGRR